jgi:hypothetical protein
VTNLLDAGPGSLRQAILDTPAGGTVDFEPGFRGTITLSDFVAVGEDLTIAGPGADDITVSGGHGSDVFFVEANLTVAISGLTVADGNGLFGGIYNGGTLTLTDCLLRGNASTSQIGGAIFNDGTLTITGSTLSDNSAASGGGIWNAGTLTLSSSTLSGNRANSMVFGVGGAIFSGHASTLTIVSSTLTGNSATSGGGAIENAGTATVNNSTVSGNSARLFGNGIYTGGTFTTGNTIIAGNRGGSIGDVSGFLDSQGYNLIGDGEGSGGFTDTDLVGTPGLPIDPGLGPLQDNGGPSPTMAVLPVVRH